MLNSTADSAVRVVLAIGGHDPTSGAGVVADCAVIAAHGVYPLSIVTGLTEQDSTGVAAILPTDAAFIRRALDRLAADFEIAAVKVGMLASLEVATEVVAWIDGVQARRRDAAVPVVVDPVLAATDGTSLLAGFEPGSLAPVIARATVLTPNFGELVWLSGACDVATREAREAAARALIDAGAQSVLVKGGHGDGAPTDVFVTRDRVRSWAWERAAETPHGTGCATSSAIAANLALGHPIEAAVDQALAFVQRRIRSAARVGRGRPLMRLR